MPSTLNLVFNMSDIKFQTIKCNIYPIKRIKLNKNLDYFLVKTVLNI